MDIKIEQSPQDSDRYNNQNLNRPTKPFEQKQNVEIKSLSDQKQNSENNQNKNKIQEQGSSNELQLPPKKSNKSSMISSSNSSPLKLQNKKTSQGDFTKKSTFLCRFCGGKKCKKEDYKKNPYENALKGVHSDWINNRIIASQRLSKRIIEEYDVITQLKENNVKAIFNLQEPGEHPYCGDGLIKETGFTYDPEDLMKNGIYFFNFNWVDMTVTSEKMIMRLMDLMDFIIHEQNGNFLVHCHAGTGRTGLAIASWLIYDLDYSAEQAIKQFQNRRKSSLQKAKQRTFLKKFEIFIKENKKSFQLKKPLCIDEIVKRQQQAHLQRHSKKTLKIPILVEYILNDINKRHEKNRDTYKTILNGFIFPGNREVFNSPWDSYMEKEVEKLKMFIDEGKFDYLQSYETRVLCQVLLDFFESLFLPTIDFLNINKMNTETEKHNKEIAKLFTDKEIINCLSLYEFSLLSKIIDFVLKILNQSKTELENCEQETKIFQDLKKKFFLRMAFALYKIQNELSEQCLQNSRYFDLNTYENFNQMNSSKEDPHQQQKTQINQLEQILDLWSFSVAQENSDLNQQEVKNCFFKAHHIFQFQEELLKKKKNKKNQVFNNLLDNDIKSLVLNTRAKKDKNPNLRQVQSEVQNNKLNSNIQQQEKNQSVPNRVQSQPSFKPINLQEVLQEQDKEDEEPEEADQQKDNQQINDNKNQQQQNQNIDLNENSNKNQNQNENEKQNLQGEIDQKSEENQETSQN